MYIEKPFDNLEEMGQAFPSQLIVMLYDEAIAALAAAIDAIGRGDIEDRFNATSRAAEVISQLYLALDSDEGGEIADSLGGIYNFILTQMPRVNFDNDATLAAEIVTLLSPIRDSWFELDERIRSEVADAEALDREIAATVIADKVLSAKKVA